MERVKPWRSDSTRAEPRVLHGYTATKEVSFRAVCETIRDYAFASSDYPLIVSLEVHTSLQQQQIMVEIMTDCWKGLLVESPEETSGNDLELPSLDELKGKIMIKVKYSPPKPEQQKTEPTVMLKNKEITSDTSSESSLEEAQAKEQPEKKKKILDSLSQLGVYTRSFHFKNFDQPEARIPTHVFSLSEKALMEVHQNNPSGLFAHNKHFLMRAYPKGVRVSSSNLDPSIFWRKGVQIVALNWQKWDAGMMLNEAMFAGQRGWVLKPPGYRSGSSAKSQQSAATHSNLTLAIEFLAGQDIPLPPEEDESNAFKPYVKCELHVERQEERQGDPIPGGGKSQSGKFKGRTKTRKTRNPDFGRETILFEGISKVSPELSFVR